MARKQTSSQYYDRLYEVSLKGGRSNPQWAAFSVAVSDLSGKAPDYGGITRIAVVTSHLDRETLATVIGSGLDDRSDLTVAEITAKTLEAEHRPYTNLVERYFKPFKEYRNLR